MARAAINLSIRQLAEVSGVGVNTVNRFERGSDVRLSSVTRLREALETAGVQFIPENGGGPGVRLRK